MRLTLTGQLNGDHDKGICNICGHKGLRYVRTEGNQQSITTEQTSCREVLFYDSVTYQSYFKKIDKVILGIDLPHLPEGIRAAKDIGVAILISMCKPDFLPTLIRSEGGGFLRGIAFPKQFIALDPLLSILVRPLQRITYYDRRVRVSSEYTQLRDLLHNNSAKTLCGKSKKSKGVRNQIAQCTVNFLLNDPSEDGYSMNFALLVSLVHSIGGLEKLHRMYKFPRFSGSRKPCAHESNDYVFNGPRKFLNHFVKLPDGDFSREIGEKFLSGSLTNPHLYITAEKK